jgi:hypothetical protein
MGKTHGTDSTHFDARSSDVADNAPIATDEAKQASHPLSGSSEAMAILGRIEQRTKALPKSLQANYALGSNMYETDFLVLAAARRTMALTEAFLLMMRERNFTVAASLLRLQLDTSLRFAGLKFVDNQQKYAREVLAGTQINHMKASNGKRLSDAFLVKALSQTFPWIPNVYRQTSGFIHLSDRHIFQTISHTKEEERMVYFSVSAEDVRRPPEAYLEILHAFEAATVLICTLLGSWVETRPKPTT